MSRMTRAVSVSPTTPSPVTLPPTRPTPGLLPSWAPLHALLSRSGCQATTSRTPPPGMTPLHAQELARGPLAAVRLHRAGCTPTPASVRWRRPSLQRGRTPAASRRLLGQQQNGLLTHPLCGAVQRKIAAYLQQYADNQNISFLPSIVSTSTRMHGEFLGLLFQQAHR